jgi:hypothetical protein
MRNSATKLTVVLMMLAVPDFCYVSAESQTATNRQIQITDERPQKSKPTTEGRLVGIVYRELFDRFTSSTTRSNYFGAFFVEVKPQDVTYLQSLFRNFLPRIECGTNNVQFKDGGIIDKATQKPAVLFWARVESVSEKMAEVEAGWHSSSESGAQFRYYLASDGINWSVTQRKQKRIW